MMRLLYFLFSDLMWRVLPLFDENWRYQPSLTLSARVDGGFR